MTPESLSLPASLRELVDAGPLTHLTTLSDDGSAQVSVIWIGRDGDEILSGHMNRYLKLRNIERDPRVVLSFIAPPQPGVFLNPYACCTPAPRSCPVTGRGPCSID